LIFGFKLAQCPPKHGITPYPEQNQSFYSIKSEAPKGLADAASRINQATSDESSYERRSRRSHPMICWAREISVAMFESRT
jgi:hypothetical protein